MKTPHGATKSELSALFDVHDALVMAYVDSNLTFAEFVSAYGDFPHNYALDAHSGSREERAVLRLFARRIAFHVRVSGLLSGVSSAVRPGAIPFGGAGAF